VAREHGAREVAEDIIDDDAVVYNGVSTVELENIEELEAALRHTEKARREGSGGVRVDGHDQIQVETGE
jgi:hypothetical protein